MTLLKSSKEMIEKARLPLGWIHHPEKSTVNSIGRREHAFSG